MDTEACNYNANATCDPNDECLMLECGECGGEASLVAWIAKLATTTRTLRAIPTTRVRDPCAAIAETASPDAWLKVPATTTRMLPAIPTTFVLVVWRGRKRLLRL